MRVLLEYTLKLLIVTISVCLPLCSQLVPTTASDIVHQTLRVVLLEQIHQFERIPSILGAPFLSHRGSLSSIPSELILAHAELEASNYNLALARLRAYLDHKPLIPFRAHAYFLRGAAYFHQYRYPLAAREFDSAAIAAVNEETLTQDRSYLNLYNSALYWKAVSYMHHGHYELAHKTFISLIQPHNTYTDDAYVGIATIAEQVGNYPQALKYYDSAYAIAPTGNLSILSQLRSAQQFILLRQPRQALIRLTAAQEMLQRYRGSQPGIEPQTLPLHVDALIDLLYAESLAQLGQFAHAIERYRNVCALHSLSPSSLLWQAQLGIGWAELNIGNYPAAIATYQTIIDSISDILSLQRAQALLFRAIAIKRSGDHLRAISLLDALCNQEDNPLRAQALLERGQIEYERGQYHTASYLFERAYRSASDPLTMLRALLLRGRAELDRQDWKAAIAAFTELELHARRVSTASVPIRDNLIAESRLWRGVAYSNNAQYSQSLTDLGQFVQEYPFHPHRDEALLWLAESYEQLGMVQEAADALELLLSQYPNSRRREEALYNLGWSQFRLRRFTDARTTFDRLLSEFPHTRYAYDATLRKADIFYLSKRYTEAAQLYRAVAQSASKSDDGEYSLFQVAQSLYRLGDYPNAIDQFRQFVRTYPTSTIADDALYNIAWIRMLQGKWNEATAMFETVFRGYPQSDLVPYARFYIAQCAYNSGNYVRAIDLYRQFLANYPTNPLAPRAIEAVQDAYINLGQDSLAIEVAREFVEINPTSELTAQVQLRTTDIFVRNRDYISAVNEYERFLAQHPTSRFVPEALYGLLKSHLALGNHEKAEEILRRLTAEHTSTEYAELALLDMATYLQDQAFTARADSLFSLIMERYSTTESHARAAFERARNALRRGDSIQAVALWQQAAASKGEYAYQARYRLGMWYRQLNNSDSARKYFRTIVAYTDNPTLAAESTYRLGELWQRDSNYVAAIDTFLLVAQRYEGVEDWYTLSLLRLAECYEAIGNITKAKELYQTVAIIRPDDDFGRTAIARRKRLDKRP